MSTIRIIILTTLLLILATLPGQPTQASPPSAATQFSCTNVSEISQPECAALVAIYNSTDGPNWVQQEGWLTTTTPCGWYGVTCGDGAVTELDLDNDHDGNRLSGALPTAIENFTNLTILDLSNNQLSSVPAEIGNLSNLTIFWLNSNQLSSVPAEIGNLSNLTMLLLYSNQLNSVPAEIGNLSNLTTLWLNSNQLSSMPAEIGNLSNLTWLDLSYNRLTVTEPLSLSFPATKNSDSQGTQTIAPTNIQATALADNSIQLTWEPIAFTEKGGSYEISTATTGSFTVHGATPDKSSNSYIVTDLLPGTTYFFRIRTYTPAHDGGNTDPDVIWDDQLNELWSEYSATISATTLGSNATFTPTPVSPTATPTFTATPVPHTATSTFTPTPVPHTATSTFTATPVPPTATSTFTPTPVPPTATPTFTPTPVPPTATPTSSGTYEPNDSCAIAQEITTNGMVQQHTFGQRGDEDWIKFETTADRTYRIEVIVPADSLADVDLELYPNCTSNSVDDWVESFSPSVRMDFTATTDGPVYMKLLNYRTRIYGDQASYQLSVRSLSDDPDNRALIIVAGRQWEGDRLQRNIHHVTHQLYETFLAYGYTNENIQYLTTDSVLTGHDGRADLHNLEVAITEWAAKQLENGGVLNLYMIDHGNVNQLYIDRERDQILTPTMLDGWLTDLEGKIDGLTINVIIEACQSGSFISPDGGSISGPGRVIITSTNDTNDAYASDEGAQFSDQFVAWLHRGYNVAASFSEARSAASEISFLQDAWLDGNGDGRPNEFDDATAAARRGFNHPGSFASDNWPPHIFDVALPASIVDQRGTIYADVRDDQNVESVWAVVYLPSYVQPETGGQLQPQLSDKVDQVRLSPMPDGEGLPDAADEHRYGGNYTFAEDGKYRVILYAKDRQGLNARPMSRELTVIGGTAFLQEVYQTYLPMISR